MKEARNAWRQLKQRYGDPNSKDAVEKIVGKMSSMEADGQQVANWVFGRSGLDGSPDTSIAVVRHLRDNVFGPDSPEWGAVREAAWLKMTRNPSTGEMLTPQRLVTQMDKADWKNQGLLRELFDDGDLLSMINRYKAAVKRLVLPARAGNPSGTTGAARRWLGDLEMTIRTYLRGAGQLAKISGDPVGGTGMFLASKVPLFGRGVERQAKQAVREGIRPRQPPSPAFTAAAQGVTRAMEGE